MPSNKQPITTGDDLPPILPGEKDVADKMSREMNMSIISGGIGAHLYGKGIIKYAWKMLR
jgi:hypothetical protein